MEPDPVTLQAADQRARRWSWPAQESLAIGSEAHKLAACRMFSDTFNPYKPAVIDWPKLDDGARARLLALPIWNIAVQTESKASLNMGSYAATLSDADMRSAIELNAWEERRHKEVLSHLVRAYGISLSPEPAYPQPRDPEWAYLVTGFSECVDSFLAFGLFELARRSGFFPPELVETFEPVMQEECRHILLFANWLAWHRRRMPWWRRIGFELRVARAWAFLAWERIGIARGMDADDSQDHNFTINGAKSVADASFGIRDLIDVCLAENDRRFAGYDRRLRRPTTAPWLARLARRFMRSAPRAASAPA